MILNRFPDKNQYLRLAERYRVVPVCTQVLADTLTPVSLLGRFYEGRGPIFLFESVEGGERWARYSFLGFSAHMLVRVFADAVEIEQAGAVRRVPHAGNPFQVLRELLAPYRPADVFGLPRFWGASWGTSTTRWSLSSRRSRTPGRPTSRSPASWSRKPC